MTPRNSGKTAWLRDGETVPSGRRRQLSPWRQAHQPARWLPEQHSPSKLAVTLKHAVAPLARSSCHASRPSSIRSRQRARCAMRCSPSSSSRPWTRIVKRSGHRLRPRIGITARERGNFAKVFAQCNRPTESGLHGVLQPSSSRGRASGQTKVAAVRTPFHGTGPPAGSSSVRHEGHGLHHVLRPRRATRAHRLQFLPRALQPDICYADVFMENI